MASIGENDSEEDALSHNAPIDYPRVDSEDRKILLGTPTEGTPSDDEVYGVSSPEQDNDSDISDDRENRFVGPSSTWRFLTEDERALAASLDQQRANDLSIHLYNAYILKSRARDGQPLARAIFKDGKKRKTNTDGIPASTWEPEASWTAWPLKHDQVPRKEERFGVPAAGMDDDDATYKKPVARNAKTDLEEEIQALMMRKATERARDVSLDVDEIEVLLDDEKAEAAFRPAIDNVMEKLDSLLLELHQRRVRLSRMKSKSKSHQSKSRSRSRAKIQTSSHDPKQQDAEGSLITQSESEAKQPSKRPPRSRPKRKPDDWIAILRAARTAGFDQAAVDRAEDRCASLFGKEAGLKVTYRCPVGDCRRGDTPYEKPWRWREHLKRSHKFSDEDVARAEATLRNSDKINQTQDSS